MRIKLWQVNRVVVDLEDRDATVATIHGLSLIDVTVRFRLKPEQVAGSP